MTYAAATVMKSKNWEPLHDEGKAVGDEASFIHNEYQRSAVHYLIPFSRQWADPLTKFLTLQKEWEGNTAHLSSMTKIVMHPAYQQIIGMGQVAVPLILSEMRKKPDHWFWALRSITGEDPVLPEHRGRLKQMTEDWLKWGRDKGYIA
ncbi:MAG: hypothetical protein HZA14_08110 [Nitrospirae bacterium]|nr:hypothetical protein [Nitrospirota bacterium]